MRTKKNRQQGQGIVELLVTLFAFFTLAFMYVQVALSFSVANYFQYIVYMGSRAYLSGHVDEAEQKKMALRLLEATLQGGGRDRFSSIARGVGDGDITGVFVGRSPRAALGADSSRDTAWEQGVTYKFKMRMYMMPMVKGAKRGEDANLELTTESWLGRDPSEEECLQALQRRKSSGANAGSGAGGADYLYDNGC